MKIVLFFLGLLCLAISDEEVYTEEDLETAQAVLRKVDEMIAHPDKQEMVEELQGLSAFLSPMLEFITKMLLPHIPNIGAQLSKFESAVFEGDAENVHRLLTETRKQLEIGLQLFEEEVLGKKSRRESADSQTPKEEDNERVEL